MIVYPGDQYAIPFKITIGNTVVTPIEASDIRIKIGSDMREYSKGELTFNSIKKTWDYYVDEDFTRSHENVSIPFQVGVKIGESIRHSAKGHIKFDNNIIKVEWSNA